MARKGWMDCKKDGFKAGYITPFVNHVYYNLFKQIYKRFFIFYFFKKGKKRIKSLFGSQSLFAQQRLKRGINVCRHLADTAVNCVQYVVSIATVTEKPLC